MQRPQYLYLRALAFRLITWGVLLGRSLAFADTITNNGGLLYYPDNISPGNTTILNEASGEVWFKFYASAENATIINNGDYGDSVVFFENSTGGNATIINNAGGIVQSATSSSTGPSGGIVSTTNYALTFGSIAGAGNFYLNTWKWTVGSNNTDTTVSGMIFDYESHGATGGSLVKVGTGTLTLLGVNSYIGGTTVLAGTLAGNSTGLQGNILNEASVVFNQTVDGTYAGVMSGTGTLTSTGPATLTLTGANTYSGGTLVSAGALQGNTTSLQGNIVNNASLIFDQEVDGVNTATISGSGSLTKIGAGTLTLEGPQAYTGSTFVNAGTLNLPGSLIGDATVGSNGTLMGTGSLQNLVNNGAVTPGAGGVGSLQVASYAGPGSLNIVVNGPSSNTLKVAGNANLTGGTLNVMGSLTGPGRYDVVSAGSITGTFSTVNTPSYTFLTFGTQYTPTDVLFTVSRSSSPFTSVAQTGNQQGVAGALDQAGTEHPAVFTKIINAVEFLTPAQAQSAYAQMSGDALGSFRTAGLGSAEHFAQQMNNRANPGGVSMHAEAPNSEPVQVAYAGDISDLNLLQATPAFSQGLWTRGVGIFDHTNANATLGSPSSEADTGGFQTGYDFSVGDHGLLGISGGYSQTSLTVSDRSSSGNSLALQLGMYGSYAPGPWIFDGSLSYSGASNKNSRTIVFSGIDETAAANFHSDVFTVFGEAGYAFHPRPIVAVEPTVSLRESHMRQNGYTESGAPGLDLTVGEQTSDSVVSSLGLRLSRLFQAKTSHPVELGVRTAWQHELADIKNLVSAQFADAPGAGFTVQSSPENRNAADLGLDIRVGLYKNLAVFSDYTATLSSDQNIQSILGGLSLRW